MTVKEWFQRLGVIERQIYSLEGCVSRAFDSGTNTGSCIVLSGNSKYVGKRISRTEESIIKKISLEESIAEKLGELGSLRRDVMAVISQVRDIDNRDIMEMRYITGWTWEKIADELGCTVRWAQIRHSTGLQEAACILRSLPGIVSEYQIDLE